MNRLAQRFANCIRQFSAEHSGVAALEFAILSPMMLALFLGSVRDSSVGTWLIVLFAAALGCTVCSLVAFLGDSLLAWHGLRREGPLPTPAVSRPAEHPAVRP